MNNIEVRAFVARDLSAAENLAQAAWAKSDKGLLEQLDIDGPNITVRLRSGTVYHLRQGRFQCVVHRTGSGRRVFVIRTDDGQRFRILELEGALSHADWDAIANHVFLARVSDLNQIISRIGLSVVFGMLAAATTVGIVVDQFGLSGEQGKIFSPLSLLLMGAWAALAWCVLAYLRRLR